MARCLAAIYDSKEDEKYDVNFILQYFEKGYVSDTLSVGDKIKYCGNAHSHATFLNKLKRFDEAAEVCSKGLLLMPYDKKLLALQGVIMTSINPDWVSDTKIKRNKKGLFASIDDEKMKEIIRIVETNDNK